MEFSGEESGTGGVEFSGGESGTGGVVGVWDW